jgi:hypothetical protein
MQLRKDFCMDNHSIASRALLWICLIFSFPAAGSPLPVEGLPNRLNPHSHASEHEKALPAFPYSDSEVEGFAKNWANVFDAQFSLLRTEDAPSTNPACDSIQTFKKLRAAYVFGRYDEVLKYAAGCGSKLNRHASRYAALAAIGLSNTKVAEGYLQLAISGLKTFDDDDLGTLLLWASWRLDSSVLDLNPNWSAQKKRFYFAVILLSNRLGLPNGVSLPDYRKFIDMELASPSTGGFKRDILVSLEARRMFYEDDTAAFEFLNRFGPLIEDPTLWARVAYRVLFASPSTPSKIFRHADVVYRATWPYLHARSALPTEDNVFTYTEIYDRECKSSLTQGKARVDFFSLKEKWRTGALATADFRKSVQQLSVLFPNKSDLLVTLSTFAHMDGDLRGSRDIAWKAHQLCPYFNRAALILTGLTKEESLRAESDYVILEQQKIADVSLLKVPIEIATYMVNWKQLTTAAQENLVWSIRGWLGYVPDLVLKTQASYVKFPFELMHEVPFLSQMKDTRSGYERDNRLWDDMRGIGGPMIVSDYFEAPQAPFGAYNLLEHEMAHQLDFYFEKEQPAIFNCIEKLFSDATLRDVFVTSYARLRYEYFAVASESFFIPVGYPLRFGVQRNWYEANDKNLHDLLAAVTSGPKAAAAYSCAL